MNVLEMHIDINLVAQKIASNVNRKFDPAEVDWLLNREVGLFILDHMKTDKDSNGFDASQVDLDAIRTLVVPDVVLPVRKKTVLDRTVYAWLPADYSYLVDDYSIVIDTCTKDSYTAATNYTTKTEYIYKFPIGESTLTNGPFYVNASILLNGNSVYSETSGPGLPTKEELFTYKDKILNTLWQGSGNNLIWYWERYEDKYERGCLLAVSSVALTTGDNSITIDGSTVEAIQSTRTFLSAPVITPPSSTVDPISNRLIKGQVRSNVLTSAFMKTRASSPVSALDSHLLRVYHDGKFIVNGVMVSYIRKPQKISLSLGQDCDLPEEFHTQIVNRTVVTIKELIMNPDWQVRLQDMMLNKA